MLSDLVVLDLSRALAGPHAGMVLGDLGARVIKVESPSGDDTRGWGPPFVGEDDSISTYFLSCNRNKESVVLDLKSVEGRRLLERLVGHADVLLENFRTGVLDRLGFSVDRLHELNPRLVICSITGFGHDGPDGSRPGYDQIVQGEAGLMDLTGDADGSPTRVGVPIADLLAGLHAVIGIEAALYERDRTGRGRVVRTSLLSSVVGIHAFQGARWTVAADAPSRTGNHHPSIAPYGLFRAGDGDLQVAVGTGEQWKRFAAVIGLDPDDARFADNSARVSRSPELVVAVEHALQGRSADEVIADLAAAGVPAGRVRTLPEVYEWEQTRRQGLLVEVDHPELGKIELPGPAIRLDDSEYAGARKEHRPPPGLGEHNESVLAWLDRADRDRGLITA